MKPFPPELRRLSLLFPVFFVVFTQQAVAQQPERPFTGLTLSGGGAKGIAHIGVLKAIDSAGLKIDYITGTSMGSVMGALYAIGYSGNEIEQIVRKLDWNELLTNQVTLRALAMEEKEEYGRYAVELPFKNRHFQVPTGALESQELWLQLSELLFPAYRTRSFSDFDIPFRCVATDLETAAAVVMDSGEITTAIRASIAIPGVFTPVDYKGMRLVDGGIVRNLPVSEVREMGADYVIASNVSHGLKPHNQLNNAVQVLMQIAFFKDGEDNKRQIGLSNCYINQSLDGYSSGSFDKSDEILESGIKTGYQYYPVFKHLADSLSAIYGSLYVRPAAPVRTDSVLLVSCQVEGLSSVSLSSFRQFIHFQGGKYYSAQQLSDMVRLAYGTRNFRYIRYRLEPADIVGYRIIFETEENPAINCKLGMHYNTFSGVSLIANATARNYFLPASRSLITLNIGENMRARAEHLQYLGRKNSLMLIPGIQYESFRVTTYKQFRKDGQFRSDYFRWDLKLQSAGSLRQSFGAGTRLETVGYSPLIASDTDIRGTGSGVTPYLFYQLNTLDNPVYPGTGTRFDAELGYVIPRDFDYTLWEGETNVSYSTFSGLSQRNYYRFVLNYEYFEPINPRNTFSALVQAGVNSDTDQNLYSAFSIGGLNRLYRNQIVFSGLENNTVFSHSVVSAQARVHRRLGSNLYLIPGASVLLYDFVGSPTREVRRKFLSGYSLTMAYNSILGPIELSAMYSDQSKSLYTYVTLGLSF
ncbi:MAG: patatin-like phospholipase family protein [Bacteroidota bacterium]